MTSLARVQVARPGLNRGEKKSRLSETDVGATIAELAGSPQELIGALGRGRLAQEGRIGYKVFPGNVLRKARRGAPLYAAADGTRFAQAIDKADPVAQ